MNNTLHVLFLCTGNAARSHLREVIPNRTKVTVGGFRAFRAKELPKDVNPRAVDARLALRKNSRSRAIS